jgi:hypothetical protein
MEAHQALIETMQREKLEVNTKTERRQMDSILEDLSIWWERMEPWSRKSMQEMQEREPLRNEKRKEMGMESPWCPEGWTDWRDSFSMMEALCLKASTEKRSQERNQVQEKSEIKKERVKQKKKTPNIMNIVGFSAFWTRVDKEATKENKENDIHTKMITETGRNQNIW